MRRPGHTGTRATADQNSELPSGTPPGRVRTTLAPAIRAANVSNATSPAAYRRPQSDEILLAAAGVPCSDAVRGPGPGWRGAGTCGVASPLWSSSTLPPVLRSVIKTPLREGDRAPDGAFIPR